LKSILDWARVRELRSGEKPGTVAGPPRQLIACAPGKVRRVEHLAALAVRRKSPTSLARLRQQEEAYGASA